MFYSRVLVVVSFPLFLACFWLADAMKPSRNRRHVVLGTNTPPPGFFSARRVAPALTMPDSGPSSPESSPAPRGRKLVDDDGDPSWEDEDYDENDEAPPRTQGLNTSHRSRNPSQPVIPVRKHRPAAPGKNVRASATKRRALRGERLGGLNGDLKIWAVERHERAKELAVKHGIKLKEVLRRMINPSTFKAQRAPSLYNAKIAHIMGELNADLPLGERLKMPEIKAMVRENPEMLTKFSEEEEEEMMEEAQKKASTKFRGTRANNMAARADAKATLLRLAREIMALAERCGMVGFAMFSRGHLHDLTIPMTIQSWGALDFFREMFKKDPSDVASMFELWCVARDREHVNPDGLMPMQKECTMMMHDGLVRELKVTKVAMNFANYIKSMVYGKAVGLIGWPAEVPFKRMSLQSSIGPLRTLRDALRDGTCHWKAKLTDKEKAKLSAEFDEWVEEGLATAPVEKETTKTKKPRVKTATSASKSKSNSTSNSTSKSSSKSTSKSNRKSTSKHGKDGAKSRKSMKTKRAVEEKDDDSENELPRKPVAEMSRDEKRQRLLELVEHQRKEGEKDAGKKKAREGERKKRARPAEDDSGGARKKRKGGPQTSKNPTQPSGDTSKPAPKRKRQAGGVIEDEDEESTAPPPKKTKRTPAQQKAKPGVQPTRMPAKLGVQPARPKARPTWRGALGAATSKASASGSGSAAPAGNSPSGPLPTPPPASPHHSPARTPPPASPPRSPAQTPPPASPPRSPVHAPPAPSPPRDSVVPDSETQDSRAVTAAPDMPPAPGSWTPAAAARRWGGRARQRGHQPRQHRRTAEASQYGQRASGRRPAGRTPGEGVDGATTFFFGVLHILS
ncbi:hypothetical protein C8R43DRAFT_1118890 [Mycena crocata]|nr:hypothetical protein C8R43DRAFT_1118890 [Mycena crocata]